MSLPNIPPEVAPDVEPKTRYWARLVRSSLRDLVSYVSSLAVRTPRNKVTEIDFGSTPKLESTFTVTDSDVTSSMYIVCRTAYIAPTGKDLDELEFDDFDLGAVAGSGQFTLYARSKYGPVSDKFKIAYSVGAG